LQHRFAAPKPVSTGTSFTWNAAAPVFVPFAGPAFSLEQPSNDVHPAATADVGSAFTGSGHVLQPPASTCSKPLPQDRPIVKVLATPAPHIEIDYDEFSFNLAVHHVSDPLFNSLIAVAPLVSFFQTSIAECHRVVATFLREPSCAPLDPGFDNLSYDTSTNDDVATVNGAHAPDSDEVDIIVSSPGAYAIREACGSCIAELALLLADMASRPARALPPFDHAIIFHVPLAPCQCSDLDLAPVPDVAQDARRLLSSFEAFARAAAAYNATAVALNVGPRRGKGRGTDVVSDVTERSTSARHADIVAGVERICAMTVSLTEHAAR
jgi:hypothetical protein